VQNPEGFFAFPHCNIELLSSIILKIFPIKRGFSSNSSFFLLYSYKRNKIFRKNDKSVPNKEQSCGNERMSE
jgi:hypothetical protein